MLSNEGALNEVVSPLEKFDSTLMTLIVVMLVVSLVCSFLCGYVIGSAHKQQIKHLNTVQVIYLSGKGECYHTISDCSALKGNRSSSLSSKRACSFCAK